MNAQDNGGPAFPVTTGNITMLGMFLRDWFAGQALAGMLVDPGSPRDAQPIHYARMAYIAADAMLTARSAKP